MTAGRWEHCMPLCMFIIDREAGEIIRLVASVCLFVRALTSEPFDLREDYTFGSVRPSVCPSVCGRSNFLLVRSGRLW